jgi:hypothetical protein
MPEMKRFIFLIVMLVALPLAVSGCGGDGDDEPSPTKAEFTRQANAICKSTVEDVQAGFSKLIQTSVPKSQENSVASAFIDSVVAPAFQGQIDEIRALGAPEGDKQQVEAILVSMEEGLDTSREEPLVFIRTGSAFKQAQAKARAYGLSAC